MAKATKGTTKSANRRTQRKRNQTKSKNRHGSQVAGYHIDGATTATLDEILDPTVPTMSLAELSEEQRVNLVVSRLQMKPDDFRVSMIGPALINKTRAIAEVRAGSRIGRTLMEIEQALLLHLAETGRKPK